jgi:hypothetical protein
VSIASLATPRLNILYNVERVGMRVLEHTADVLRDASEPLPGGSGGEGGGGGGGGPEDPSQGSSKSSLLIRSHGQSLHPAYVELVLTLVRLCCVGEAAYLPPVDVGASLPPGVSPVGARVCLPVSAFDLQAAKLLAAVTDAPTSASWLPLVFSEALTALSPRVVALQRFIEVAEGVLEAALRKTPPPAAGALGPAAVPGGCLFPLQVWGFTNVARTGGNAGFLASDGDRGKRLIAQCADCTSAMLTAVVTMVETRVSGPLARPHRAPVPARVQRGLARAWGLHSGTARAWRVRRGPRSRPRRAGAGGSRG